MITSNDSSHFWISTLIHSQQQRESYYTSWFAFLLTRTNQPQLMPTLVPFVQKTASFPCFIIEFSKMKAQAKIGNFIDKLQSLLENHHYSHIIHWTNDRKVIEISNLDKMTQDIIPLYFRHRKFESFVRQLNLYGFRKLKAQGKHRFTHEQLQLGKGLASVTSVKCRSKDGQENTKDEAETQGKANENVELLMGSWRKIGSSAFRVYNPENRSNILLSHRSHQKQERRPLLEGQNTQEYQPVSSPSFFMWNFMDFFNKNLFTTPITPSNPEPQPQEILQQ